MTKQSDLHVPSSEVSRRMFLKAGFGGAAALAGWSVLGGKTAFAQAGQAARGPAAITMSLNDGWLFGGLWASGNSQPGFDDSHFEPVTLPHCVVPLSWRNWNPDTWGNKWGYRRHFDLPPSAVGMRVFLDFGGALTTTAPSVNGHALPKHQGGYLPFSYELTDLLTGKNNVLAVEVDSTWQDVPPDGNPLGPESVDYFEPGGLYRGVALRFVPQIYISDIFAKPLDVLSPSRRVQVECTVDSAVTPSAPLDVLVEIRDAGRTLASASAPVPLTAAGESTVTVELNGLGSVQLWDTATPKLYEVVATLRVNRQPLHDFTRRVGFREATFTTDGFFLNGERLKLFGLDRHQIYPYTGMAMPPRVQRRDAELLKQLNCNMVRCSHYPQSEHFLDACDELGIMVWEETPGWGYLGDAPWQTIMLQNVHDMVVRDRSRPSVIIWGVQPNETPHDNDSLWTQSKDLADSLDGSRPTSGTSWHSRTDFVFDVMAYDDYSNSQGNAYLAPPVAGVPYLVTEAVGALDWSPFYRRIDAQIVQQAQARLHAQVHDIAASKNAYCGLLGWSALDYESGDATVYENMKWTGVVDIFREPKPGAAFYLAQRDPAAGPVIEPAFYWDFAPFSPVTALGKQAAIWSNCDRLEASIGGSHYATLQRDSTDFTHLAYPPFYLDTTGIDPSALPDLHLDGYIGSELVLSKSFAGDPTADRLDIRADDATLIADGSDATRVVFRAVDRYGSPRPYVEGLVSVAVDGPAVPVGQVVTLTATSSPELVTAGEEAVVTATLSNGTFEFEAAGGVGAVYMRTLTGAPGPITVTVSHPTLGSATVRLQSVASNAGEPATRETAPSLDLTGIALSLAAPEGWTSEALSPVTFDRLSAHGEGRAMWKVKAPASVAQGAPTAVSVRADYLLGGRPATTESPAPLYLATDLTTAFDNVGITDDSDTGPGDIDGKGTSYSQQALNDAGVTPGGTVIADGVNFTWPAVPAGTPDNVMARQRTILVSGSGRTLGFLGAASKGNGLILGKVFYHDGTSSKFSVMLDNFLGKPGPENLIAVHSTYVNTQSGPRNKPADVFYAGVPIDPTKTLKAVTLTSGTIVQPTNGFIRGAHVFAVGVG